MNITQFIKYLNKEKGWELALHGCYHKYTTKEGGINPVNQRSEFAGVPLDKQKEMIRHGVDVLKGHDIEPKVFFAPSHTFDENTLVALKEESDIRIISDTIANDVYFENNFYFIPQQSGRVRKLDVLERFLKKNAESFRISITVGKKRGRNLLDRALRELYFLRR